MQRQIGFAEERPQHATGATPRGRYPLTAPQIAWRDFDSLASMDMEARQGDARWTATADTDTDLARHFREGYAGLLTDDELVG